MISCFEMVASFMVSVTTVDDNIYSKRSFLWPPAVGLSSVQSKMFRVQPE